MRSDEVLARFVASHPFPLDPFQVQACTALVEGRHVLVAAPTGAGKTVVGALAAELALARGGRCAYTTPIKALSNQKWHELSARFGAGRVGLLTGDVSRNPDAPVLVMTTEVLRNMLVTGSDVVPSLRQVVLDEVHYLGDRSRGMVWEEVVLALPTGPPSDPARVQLTALSATVSNAEELGAWLAAVLGPTEVVVDEVRPVPLWQHVMAGSRLLDLLVDDPRRAVPVVNPELVALAERAREADAWGDRRPARGRHRPRERGPRLVPGRLTVVDRLARAGLVPAIVFVFSRAGCDAAVAQLVAGGVSLTSPEERRSIDRAVDERLADLDPDDLDAVGVRAWRQALQRGVAAHHAGLLPVFREVVEQCVVHGWVKVVVATETLALGVNLPARTVVLERLRKWNGSEHADLTPGEYTQLTGRAGRRGIDHEGHAVVLWQPDFDPRALAGLASTRTFPLRSAFRPTYGMAVHLVHRVGRAAAHGIVGASFAQFQLDRAVVAETASLRRAERQRERQADICGRGDLPEYLALHGEVSRLEVRRLRGQGVGDPVAAAASLRGRRVGDVLLLPGGRRGRRAVVLEPRRGSVAEPKVRVLTDRGEVRTLTADSLEAPVPVVGRLSVPAGFDVRRSAERGHLARQVRALPETPGASRREANDAAERELHEARAALRAHPVHGCPDRRLHLQRAAQVATVERQVAARRRSDDHRRETLADQLDRVLAVLDELGYLDGDRVTPAGQRLRLVFAELDLLVAECRRRGVWAGLPPADLAAVVAAVVAEGRGREDAAPHLPPGPVRVALAATEQVHGELVAMERRHGLALLRPLDLRLTDPAWRWAAGQPFEAVLADADSAPGDLVRALGQVVDGLEQLTTSAAGTEVAAVADRAARRMRRGLLAYTPGGWTASTPTTPPGRHPHPPDTHPPPGNDHVG